MSKRLCVLFFAVVVFLASAMALSSLGLDVTVQAGGGAAMGITDEDLKSGMLQWSVDVGLILDTHLFNLWKLGFGLPAGANYTMLNFYGITDISGSGIPGAGDRTSEARYNYLFIPITLVGKMAMKSDSDFTVRLDGFAAYFLVGKTDLTYDPELPLFGLLNGEYDLDDSNTEQWMYGIRIAVSAELFSKGKISTAPGIQFDIGLTDTSVNIPPIDTSKDTFWSLTANIGIRYSLFLIRMILDSLSIDRGCPGNSSGTVPFFSLAGFSLGRHCIRRRTGLKFYAITCSRGMT